MKPNKYQLIVLDDLRSFLARWRLTNNPAAAFNDHWLAQQKEKSGIFNKT